MKNFRLVSNIKNTLSRVRYILPSLMLVGAALSPLAVAPTLASASPTINEYAVTTGHTYPTAIVNSGGSEWYLNSPASLSSITTSGTTTNYSIIPAGETGTNISIKKNSLAADASGNVWYAGCDYNSSPGVLLFGYVNSSTHAQTSFKNSSYKCLYSVNTFSIGQPVIDAVGNIWINLLSSYSHASSMAQFNSSGVQISGWSLTGGTQQWSSVVAGPGNSLWAVDSNDNKIDQLTLSPTNDTITGMTAYTPTGVPGSITTSPDSNLWFTESGGVIAKMTPTGAFTYYSLPAGSGADTLTTGPDSALWFTDSTSNSIGRITMAGGVTEYAIPTTSATPLGITAGPDNALWFTESTANKIGRISAAPFVNEYPLSTGHTSPTAIVSSGGSEWYINNRNSLSSITPSGTTSDYNMLPAGETGSNLATKNNSLAADASGNVWYVGCDYTVTPSVMLLGYVNSTTHAQATFKDSGKVCLFNPITVSPGQPVVDASGNIWVDLLSSYTHASSVAQYNSSGVQISGWSPTGGTQQWTSMVAGPSNSLWAIDSNNNQIDQLTLSLTTDTVTGMTAYTPTGVPGSITTGPDGNLWITESGGVIAKMTPSGVFTYYNLPTGSYADNLTTGPDGALWFTDSTSNSIGRITTAGSVTEYAVPTTSATPLGITAGPDNALWFTEYTANKIGRIGY